MRMTFSKILDSTGSRLMGLYEVGCSAGGESGLINEKLGFISLMFFTSLKTRLQF